MTGTLYQLRFDDGATYFGVAANVDARRLRHEHLARVYAGRVNFVFEPVQTFESQDAAFAAERAAVAQARAQGLSLRNTADGGRGGGGRHSSETRAKISAAKMGARAHNAKFTKESRARLFIMRHVSGWSVPELADSFGTSAQCIYRNLRRAA